MQSDNGASELIQTVWLSINQLHFNSWYCLVQVLFCLVTSFVILNMYYRFCTHLSRQVPKSHEIIIWLFFFCFFAHPFISSSWTIFFVSIFWKCYRWTTKQRQWAERRCVVDTKCSDVKIESEMKTGIRASNILSILTVAVNF